ncbi:HAUS augmin-like complex subunit 7 [Trematomus bernacchii]|uniref:HAUS augmin-like complex subunit 7 n=1 Tax=Trematomus bernacchii TaxID=40690 RepID=UPI00146A8663|nr:HAUS augmin-like complex subunit 7 [Trematomus bernacchii]
MAGALKEKQLVGHVYATLQAAPCPLVEALYLQEADSMLQLLCTPSQHRTDILAWICSSINPTFAYSEAISLRSKDPEVRIKEMSVLGQELMLCRAEDLDLIRGDASPHRQLRFLQQLLSLVPACEKSAGHRTDQETLLNELYAAENLPHFTQMLAPTLDPWPAHIKALHNSTKSSSHRSSGEEAADGAALLQQAQSTLEKLQSECEFLSSETQSSGVFSPGSLRVAACDLQMLMAAFSHVFETDLRAYCSRDPPSFSTETHVFQRIHQLLPAFIMELDMLKEVSEASASVTEEVEQLQTQPSYRSRGEKRNLPDQLEELTRRIRDVFSLLQS